MTHLLIRKAVLIRKPLRWALETQLGSFSAANMPRRTPATNETHSSVENSKICPPTFLESRTKTARSRSATSIQLEVELAVLFRQLGRAESIRCSPRCENGGWEIWAIGRTAT
jgi:hypothetical protein